MTTDLIREQLGSCYTGVVNDMMRARGLRNFTLPTEIRPLTPETTLCGPVFTVEGHIDEAADAHETLLAWTGLLSKAPAGHIWVSQPHDHTVGHMGELSAEALHLRGILGCVVDGGVRDTGFIKRLGFSTWHRFFTSRDVVGRWLPTGTDVDIVIGEVLISPGDYLLGDLDGLVRVPKALAAEIAADSVVAMNTESKVRTAILAGTDPQTAYLKFGKF
jgi:regulator of RNase E activity RraA